MWEELPERFDVSVLLTSQNAYDLAGVRVSTRPARSLRTFLPRGRFGDLAMGLTGDRYLAADEAFAAADVVHTEELGYWHSGDAARRKATNGYKLVVTAWETLPLLSAYRNPWARTYRHRVLAQADLFLPVTERARDALVLEGAAPERVEVCYPGIDLDRFSAARADAAPAEHVLVSPGRLVWEKGHHDVMRAIAAIRTGVVAAPEVELRLLVVGSGPEEQRLQAFAAELGLADIVEFTSLPYGEMPDVYARASCLVLASLPNAACARWLGDLPHCFWEEQFGMVLAEAMAAGLPVIASSSGAIPEVVGGSGAYFVPGDWLGLARLLAEGPLARPAGERVQHPQERVERYSTRAAAARLAAAYDRVLAASAPS